MGRKNLNPKQLARYMRIARVVYEAYYLGLIEAVKRVDPGEVYEAPEEWPDDVLDAFLFEEERVDDALTPFVMYLEETKEFSIDVERDGDDVIVRVFPRDTDWVIECINGHIRVDWWGSLDEAPSWVFSRKDVEVMEHV